MNCIIIITQYILITKLYKLTLFWRSGLQLAMRISRQLWLWPFWQHRCSAANPPKFLMCMLALPLHKTATQRLKPFQLASCNAVFPCWNTFHSCYIGFKGHASPSIWYLRIFITKKNTHHSTICTKYKEMFFYKAKNI